MSSQPEYAPHRHETGDIVAVLGLLLLAAIPYLNGLTNAFVYDDLLQLVGNPYAHNFRYLGKIFGSTVWTFEGAQGVTNYYRPLMTFAYLIGYKIFGLVPLGFHLMSLILHMGVVLLLFFITEQLFGNRLMALVAAALFALHPIHTESVAWIAGITDLELSFFFLLVFLLYVRLGEAELTGSRTWTLRAGIAGTYFLALLSKEQALMLPLVAATYEHFYRPSRVQTPFSVKFRRYFPLCILAVAYLAFRRFGLGSLAPAVARPDLPWGTVILTAVALVGAYLGKLIWPAHLSAFYVFHANESWSDGGVLAGFAALLACLILFLWLWRRAHMLSFAFLWMGLTLGPVLNARWMPADVFAERYLYLPSVGFCWLVAWAAVTLWRGSGAATAKPSLLRQLVPVTLAIMALFYGVATVRRNRVWRSDDTLYRSILAQEPDAQLIRTNLGTLYFDAGDLAGAEREWTQSLGPAKPFVSTLSNMGLLRTRQGRYAEAVDYFHQAIDYKPLYSSAHKNLGSTYEEMGQAADAEREFKTAVTLAPLDISARNTYGHFLVEQGREAEAREQFRLSDEADANGDAEESLGEIFSRAGDPQRARASFQAALAANPFDGGAHFGLAALYEHQGDIPAALREYHAGLDTDPHNEGGLAALRRLGAADGSPKAPGKP